MSDSPNPHTIRDRILSHKGALTAHEVADLFNVSCRTVHKHAKDGVMPSFRIGDSVRFDPLVLADWYEGQQFGLPPSRRAVRGRP
ncbi:helix-turn-helix domain-containing protein [Granulicella sp. L46]|uniref:helix-turn-helix domain-containing protein n=1 Tax=Granulicella sp. L46 TaxID=1641865 RepID=UPI00131D4940